MRRDRPDAVPGGEVCDCHAARSRSRLASLFALLISTAFAAFNDWGLDAADPAAEQVSPAVRGRPAADAIVDGRPHDGAGARRSGRADHRGQGSQGERRRRRHGGQRGPNIDQMVLWPQSNPTHIIACNEEGTTEPALQKINLATGKATTIATGIDDCDPVRATPWGTVIFGEEAGATARCTSSSTRSSVEGATIDRATGVSSTPNIGRVDALGFIRVRGPGGPAERRHLLRRRARRRTTARPAARTTSSCRRTPWAGGAPITSLDQSPYAGGHGVRRCASARAATTVRASSTASAPGSRSPGASGAMLRPLATAAQADRLLPARGHRHRRGGARRRQRPLLRQQHRP